MNKNAQIAQLEYGAATQPTIRLSEAGLTVGTMIMTPDGQKAVDDLKVGDRVLTKDYGHQRLKCVAFRDVSLSHSDEMAPVRLCPDCIGHERPAREIYLAPTQRIAMRHPMFDLMFGAREVLARTGDLRHLTGIDQVKGLGGITYVMLGFSRPQLVFTGNLALDLGAIDAQPTRPILSVDEARLACAMIAPQPTNHLNIGLQLH